MAREDACEHDMLVQIRGKGGRWPFLLPKWSPSIQTNQPRKLSALGVTGFRRVTAFNLRTATFQFRLHLRNGHQFQVRPIKVPTSERAGFRWVSGSHAAT